VEAGAVLEAGPGGEPVWRPNVSGSEEREASAIVGGVLSKNTVDELTNKLRLICGGREILATEVRGLHVAVESRDREVPRCDESLGHVGRHEGLSEILHGGRLRQFFIQVSGAVVFLLVDGVD
jgi:hypothetical protein